MEEAQKVDVQPKSKATPSKRGRPRIDPYWENRVYSILTNSPRLPLAAVHRKVKEEGQSLGREAPSLRTVGRLREKYNAESSDLQRSLKFVRWPESFGVDLPWESAPAVAELLRHTLDKSSLRPTVRLATWYWRVTQLAPNESPSKRRQLAMGLSSVEGHRLLGGDSERMLRRLERSVLGLTPTGLASPGADQEPIRSAGLDFWDDLAVTSDNPEVFDTSVEEED